MLVTPFRIHQENTKPVSHRLPPSRSLPIDWTSIGGDTSVLVPIDATPLAALAGFCCLMTDASPGVGPGGWAEAQIGKVAEALLASGPSFFVFSSPAALRSSSQSFVYSKISRIHSPASPIVAGVLLKHFSRFLTAPGLLASALMGYHPERQRICRQMRICWWCLLPWDGVEDAVLEPCSTFHQRFLFSCAFARCPLHLRRPRTRRRHMLEPEVAAV